jgi:hypothetical protein
MGERDSPELQIKTQPLLGSARRQQSTFREFGMPRRAFELYRTDCNIQGVCEVAVAIGFLDDALSLIENRVTLQDSILYSVFNHVQTKDILTAKSHTPLKTENRKLGSLQQQWKSLATTVNAYKRKGDLPDRSFIQEGILYDYFDLLVCDILDRYVTIPQLTIHHR